VRSKSYLEYQDNFVRELSTCTQCPSLGLVSLDANDFPEKELKSSSTIYYNIVGRRNTHCRLGIYRQVILNMLKPLRSYIRRCKA
jgi:hypothetical protein